MKTQINDHYIDLRTIAAIGPLKAASGGSDDNRRYGFVIYTGSPGGPYGSTSSLWVNAAPDILDPHSIETAANDAIKEKAKAAYNQFVTDWKSVS